MATEPPELNTNVFPTLEDRTNLLTHLKLLGFKEIEVEFSGGGDEGGIDDIITTPKMDLKSIECSYAWDIATTYDINGKWERKVIREPKNMYDFLESLTYDVLNDCNLDYVNNEGGHGSFFIDFTESPPQLRLNIFINEPTEYNYDY